MRAVATDDPALEAEEPKQPRNRWIWVSAVLAVVAVGLLAWALSLKSDLDSTQDKLAEAQKKVDSTQEQLASATKKVEDLQAVPAEEEDNGDAAVLAAGAVAAKALYNDLSEQLGTTQEDLAATQQSLEEAEKNAKQAEKDAAAAEERAAEAGNATEKAQAEAEQARAEADAANAKLAIAKDCAKAYISSFGVLLEAEDPEAKGAEVRDEFESITADCKAALEGS
jgi:chromosome segregation ATPase